MGSDVQAQLQLEPLPTLSALKWIQTHLAALTAIGTAFGYGNAYLQARGEAEVTTVPMELVTLSSAEITRAVMVGCFASGFIAGTFALGIGVARRSVPVRSPWFRAGLWLCSGLCFGASAFLAARIVGLSHGWWVGSAVVGGLEVWGVLRLYTRIPTPPGLKTPVDFAELGVCLTLGLALMLSHPLGANRARNTTDYYVVDAPAEPPTVVLRMNSDKLIIAPLHAEERTYDQEFRVIELGEQRVHKERLGSLTPRPVTRLAECK